MYVSVCLWGRKLAGETGYVKVTAVQGPSFNVNDRVIYHGCEMIVSEAIDSDGEIRMVNLMVVKALADALRVNPSLRYDYVSSLHSYYASHSYSLVSYN